MNSVRLRSLFSSHWMFREKWEQGRSAGHECLPQMVYKTSLVNSSRVFACIPSENDTHGQLVAHCWLLALPGYSGPGIKHSILALNGVVRLFHSIYLDLFVALHTGWRVLSLAKQRTQDDLYTSQRSSCTAPATQPSYGHSCPEQRLRLLEFVS